MYDILPFRGGPFGAWLPIIDGNQAQAGSSTPTSGTIRAIVKCTVGLALVVSYAASSAGQNNEVMKCCGLFDSEVTWKYAAHEVMTKHWILNNIMGLSFCLLGIRQGPRWFGSEVAFLTC